MITWFFVKRSCERNIIYKTVFVRKKIMSENKNISKGINSLFESYPYFRLQKETWISEIQNHFSIFFEQNENNLWFYMLHKFTNEKPFCYFNSDTINESLLFLRRNLALSIESILKLNQSISRAVFSLLRQSSSWSHEESFSLDKPNEISKFEYIWHPEYQRYCEHVYNHLIDIFLYVLGKQNSKEFIKGNPLFNRVELLKKFGFKKIINGYNPIIRNAISHGNVKIGIVDIQYTDAKGRSLRIPPRDISSIFDSLIECNNSMVIALLIFISENIDKFATYGIERIPLGVRFLLYESITKLSDFCLLSAIETEYDNRGKQLNLICKIGTKSRALQITDGVNLCWNIMKLGGKEYSRFFISFDCGKDVMPSLAINGVELKKAIDKNSDVTKSSIKIIESSLLWYDENSLRRKFFRWKRKLNIIWKDFRRIYINELVDKGISRHKEKYEIDFVRNISSDTSRRSDAFIRLFLIGEISGEMICDIAVQAGRVLRRRKVKKVAINGEYGIKKKPDYLCMRFFIKRAPLREYQLSSWRDSNLLAIAEFVTDQESFHYTKDFDLSANELRIKFNPSFVRSS